MTNQQLEAHKRLLSILPSRFHISYDCSERIWERKIANRKPVVIAGMTYKSLSAAAKSLGVTVACLSKRKRRWGTYMK